MKLKQVTLKQATLQTVPFQKMTCRRLYIAALTLLAVSFPTIGHAALPQGVTADAETGLIVAEHAHATCESCTVLTVTNPTGAPLAVRLSIDPLPLPAANDRSFGSWIYRYSHELVDQDGDIEMAPEEGAPLVQGFASRKRLELRALMFDGESAAYTPGSLSVALPIAPGSERTVTAYFGATVASELKHSPPERFLYWTLWQPLRALCIWVENLIAYLLPAIGAFATIALIVLCVRAITFPINRWSFRSQQTFEAVQRDIAPAVADIKSRLKGADQSEAIFELYQSRGVNPLSGLKGSVGLFVQIPILIAMFNVASDSAVLSGVPLAWVPNIAQPEHTFSWGVDLPLLGNYFNLIAFGLAAFMLWSELTKSERSTGSLVFAVVVGVLLYSFPAFLVVYWFLITVAQYVEQKLATR